MLSFDRRIPVGGTAMYAFPIHGGCQVGARVIPAAEPDTSLGTVTKGGGCVFVWLSICESLPWLPSHCRKALTKGSACLGRACGLLRASLIGFPPAVPALKMRYYHPCPTQASNYSPCRPPFSKSTKGKLVALFDPDLPLRVIFALSSFCGFAAN